MPPKVRCLLAWGFPPSAPCCLANYPLVLPLVARLMPAQPSHPCMHAPAAAASPRCALCAVLTTDRICPLLLPPLLQWA